MNSNSLGLTEPEVEEALPEDPVLSDSMDMYLNRIGRRRLLGAEEERELARRAKAGDEIAKCILVESNLKLVVSVAKVYSRSGVPLPDLIQEGNIGLIKAVDSFDPDKGFRFSTYAVAWIRQAITRAIERQGRAIRIPSYVIQAIRKLNKAGAAFLGDHGREPTVEDLSEQTGMAREKVIRLLEASEALVSLDDAVTDEAASSLLERLTDLEALNPEQDALQQEGVEVLNGLMAGLSIQEKLIIEKRFGMADGVASTLQEIGQQLNITRERVRQLEGRALRKLRLAITRNWLETYFQT